MKQLISLFVLSMVAFPTLTYAQASPLQCAPTESIDKFRFLRQLSLDLLGRPPTIEELEEIASLDDLGEQELRALFQRDEYYAQVREYHRNLLWSTVRGYNYLATRRRQLAIAHRRDDGNVYYLDAGVFRGGKRIKCLDQPQTEFDENGWPIPIEGELEGYVEVSPYWAPDITMKVCAFDAAPFQEESRADKWNSGCGPNLVHCEMRGVQEPNLDVSGILRQVLEEEPTRIFEHIIRNNQSYLEAFTTKNTMMNGPLAHYYRYMTGLDPARDKSAIAFESEVRNLPEIPFSEQSWQVVER